MQQQENDCEPLCCLSRQCLDQGIVHSRNRDYWHVLRLSDSADDLPPPPEINNALCGLLLHLYSVCIQVELHHIEIDLC